MDLMLPHRSELRVNPQIPYVLSFNGVDTASDDALAKC
jgi:hypothetical protein